jgi:beta-phosphoglucomutase-like phosphatase (HAD superfamily)
MSPKDCVVIEDGINGMLAAQAAGMKCIALVTDTKTKYPCNNLVKSLDLINQQYLQFLK